MNIVSARRTPQGVRTQSIRDAFLDLDPDARRMLKMSQVKFIERDDDVLVLGDDALQMAAMFDKEARRPLSAGLISSSEVDSLEILGILIRSVLGEPQEKEEVCYFSVPAAPVDIQRDVIYHRKAFERIVEECGYQAYPSNEAMAIVYAEAAKDGFSGVGISYGCLTPDSTVISREGLKPIAGVQEGEEVLSKDGAFHRVPKTWVRDYQGPVYDISFYGNPQGVSLTGNHQVWVQTEKGWSWMTADRLQRGDIIGEPVVAGHGRRVCLAIQDKDRNSKAKKKVLEWSSSLGRFLGYFLADGHLSRSDVNRKGRYSIWVDFGPSEQAYVEDLKGLVERLFQRSVSVSPHGNDFRCQFSHSGLHTWLSANCYREGAKFFPLHIEDLKPNVVEGLIVGLVRGDGRASNSEVHFGNSSLSLVTAFHLLIGRLGLTSTLSRRNPRGAALADGRVIQGKKEEWTAHVTGWDGSYLQQLVNAGSPERRVRVWKEGGFRCTCVRDVSVRDYAGPVHDLTVEDEHSFVTPYMTLHNSGMTNVALSVKAMPVLEFSVSRGGDWIDKGASQSVGTTQSRMCTIKEKGVDLMDHTKGDPKQLREREALSFYYQDLIDYSLRKIAEQFLSNCRVELQEPIPIIVSGGTSLAGGFLELFQKVFKKHQRRFPIEISEIRQAKDPLSAVSHGLLVQAMQEYEG